MTLLSMLAAIFSMENGLNIAMLCQTMANIKNRLRRVRFMEVDYIGKVSHHFCNTRANVVNIFTVQCSHTHAAAVGAIDAELVA